MEPRTLKDFIDEVCREDPMFRYHLWWAGLKLSWSIRLYRWSEWLRKN